MNSNQTSINYGFIGGMAAIALSLLYYILNVRGYVYWGGLFAYLALGATMVMAAKAVRTEQDGFIEFKEALKASFLVWVIGSGLLIIFTYVLYNFIDTGLAEVRQEVVTKVMESVLSNLDESVIEEVNDEMAEEGFEMDLKNVFRGYGYGLIFPGFFMALIISLIMKKKRPVQFDDELT